MASTPAPLTTRPATPLPPRSTADRPPPDLRTEAFVRSQIPYLDYYQRQGEALWSAYLDTLEDERDKDERNAAVRPSRKPSLVHPTGLEGLQGVDLLNELAAKGTSVASGSKEILSGGLGRVRLIDRMKGKDGEERKRVGATTKKTAKEPKKEPKEPRISKPTPQEPLINSTELDHSESGGSEVVLTRKELQRRLGPQTQSTRLPTITPAHGASLSPIEPLAPAGSRSAKKRASSEVIASSDQVSSPDKRRRTRRTDPELQTSSTHHIRPSSPLRKTPHRTTRTPRSVSVLHLSELSATVECANDPKTKEKAKITPTDPTGKRPKVKTKPAISTEEEVVVQKRGFQGLNETDGCDADHVVSTYRQEHHPDRGLEFAQISSTLNEYLQLLTSNGDLRFLSQLPCLLRGLQDLRIENAAVEKRLRSSRRPKLIQLAPLPLSLPTLPDPANISPPRRITRRTGLIASRG